MGDDAEAKLASELLALRASIEHEAAATEANLNPGPFQDDARSEELPGHEELCRQLTALRERVERTLLGIEDPRDVRAELATLFFFAGTLRRDAQAWRAGLAHAVAELERKRAQARREEERLAVERAERRYRRRALQAKIDREADAIARHKQGECRRTLPVITLHPGLTVSSMTVSSARTRFRSLKLWLITLNESRDDILVRRD
jgi:hypothetical protein